MQPLVEGKVGLSLVAEVAVEESFETATMAGLVASHLVYGVVDSVEVKFLGTLSNTSLVVASSALSVHALFEVGLRVPYAVAKEFCKFSSVLSLFPSVALERLSNFGIAFAVCLAAHGQVHTNFCTFAHEVVVEVLDHLFVTAFGNAKFVLGNEGETGVLFHFFEFKRWNTANRTASRSFITFVDVTAYGADKFLFLNL